jgi:hypothetical protein
MMIDIDKFRMKMFYPMMKVKMNDMFVFYLHLYKRKSKHKGNCVIRISQLLSIDELCLSQGILSVIDCRIE